MQRLLRVHLMKVDGVVRGGSFRDATRAPFDDSAPTPSRSYTAITEDITFESISGIALIATGWSTKSPTSFSRTRCGRRRDAAQSRKDFKLHGRPADKCTGQLGRQSRKALRYILLSHASSFTRLTPPGETQRDQFGYSG